MSLRDFYHHKPNTAGRGSQTVLMELYVWRCLDFFKAPTCKPFTVYFAMRMATDWHSVTNERWSSKTFSCMKCAIPAKRGKWYYNDARFLMHVQCHTKMASEVLTYHYWHAMETCAGLYYPGYIAFLWRYLKGNYCKIRVFFNSWDNRHFNKKPMGRDGIKA